MATIIPPIREFPKDGRRWRIDWLGAIRPNHERAYERTIDVIISPVRDGIVNPFKPGDVLKEERQIIRIGIGQLPLLKIGSIWKEGQLQNQTAGTKFLLNRVQAYPQTISTIPTSNKEGSHWTIPPYVHEVGRQGLGEGFHAKCITIMRNDDPFGIILPVAEAIRFYYANSTKLAHAVFDGTYQHKLDDLVNIEQCGFLAGTRCCTLRLRKKIRSEDGWILGRILNSPHANSGARLVHDSIMIQTTANKTAYPNTSLPFSETVKWSARGIEFMQSGKKRFLIFELLHCSASFPYDELEVTRDNPGHLASNPNPFDNNDITRPKAKVDDNAELQTGEEPSTEYDDVNFPYPNGYFDAIKNKSIITPQSEHGDYGSGQISGLEALTVSQFGTGQGSYENGTEATGQAQIVPSDHVRQRPLTDRLKDIYETAQHLNDIPGLTASMMPSLGDELYLPLLSLPRKRQWGYLDSRTRTRRRVRAINICFQHKRYYFIEFEIRDSEKKTAGLLWSFNYAPLEDAEFNEAFIIHCQEQGQWKPDKFSKSGYDCQQLKHTWDSPMGCANRIFNHLKKHSL